MYSINKMTITVAWRVMTHKGLVRSQNEDAHYIAHSIEESEPESRYLFAVADGLGGHRGGAIASRMALKYVKDEFLNWHGGRADTLVARALNHANQEIFIASQSDPKLFNNMQTTLTAAALEQDLMTIGHVGDCRLYRIRNNNVEVLTKDHTIANDMLKLHLISKEQARHHPGRHQLTRSIGGDPFLRIDLIRKHILPSDIYLLCSDGLWSELSNEDINIAMQEINIGNACEKLVGIALQEGAQDNITAIMFRIGTIGKKTSTFSLRRIFTDYFIKTNNKQ